nr:hypothetical protein [Tanacetum cinerariifolium]
HSHSSSHSMGPSRKRCMTSDDIIPSYILASGALVPTRADLLPPQKMFRDSISPTQFESDTKMPEGHVSPTPHDAMLTRWRSRVASRSSSPTTSTLKIPTASILPAPCAVIAPSTDIILPVYAPPKIHRRRAILIRHGQDIPIVRLYSTYPGGPCRALTVRKSVIPLPSHRLAMRYTSYHLDRFTSRSSSSHSSSDHSSSERSILGHSVSRHTPPVTTIADLSAPLRFVYPPLARTPRYNEANRHWRSAPLSTMYPSTTSESLIGDSSSESSAGPSCKRCRSPDATVTSSIHALRALVPSHADPLPPCKRFRDSTSLEDSVEEDIDTDVSAYIKVDAIAVEVAADMDVETGVNAGIGMGVDVRVDLKDEVESSDRCTMEVRVDVVAGIDIPNGMLMPDVVERLEQVEEVVQDIYGHVIEIPLKGQLKNSLTNVAEVLVAYEENHAPELAVESQSQNGDDNDKGNFGGNGNRNGRGNGDENGGGNGIKNGGGNGNGNPNMNDRGVMPVVRECTYHDSVKCQPLNFKGTEGVVRLTRWFGKMETVFYISNCPERYQVKYATCTLLNSALSWWNAHKRIIGADVALERAYEAYD